MRWMLFLLVACTTAPSVKRLTHEKIENKECLRPLENITVRPEQTVLGLFKQTAGTAGTVVATGAGVVSDTVVVSTGLIGTAYLCVDGHFCDDIMGGYVGIMEEADMLWTTKKAYKASSSWRCPYVDHISKAFRKVSSCLHEKKEFVAAFEQLNIIEANSVLSECVSATEKEKLEELRTQFIYPSQSL